MLVTIAVEGPSDEAVLRRLMESVGLGIAYVYGLQGKGHLDSKLRAYNSAARTAPWMVLRDLDRDAACAPELVKRLLPRPAPMMQFRVAVRSLESWLLADRTALSRFLQIRRETVPENPDALADPKATLVAIARASRNRAIREDIVPPRARGVGRGYSSRVIEYARRHWRPAEAAKHSDSLNRCIRRLRALARWHKNRS